MKTTEFRLNRKALLGIMVLAAAGALPAQAATLAADPTAVDEATDTDSKCSLREAVLSVNGGANIGGCTADVTNAYGTNDTITLATGTYNLTVIGLDEGWVASTGAEPYVETNTPDATMGDIDILKSVRIVGAGADATIIQWDGAVAEASRDRIFHIFTTELAAVVNVAIEGVTIQNGRTFQEFIEYGPDNTGSPVVASTEYYLRRAGGGLAVGPAANVVLIDPALTGDENAQGRGGSQRPTEPDEGGATFSLTLTNVKVSANQAQGDGAGIYTASPMTATGILVSANITTVNGGGIYNEGDSTISNSTISDNIAEGGGGIFMTGSNTVNISGTTLSSNHAVGGGAISGRAGMTLNLVNSTLSGNIGVDVGAGLYTNGNANLKFVTIANNMAGSDSATQGSGINVFPASQTANAISLKNVLLSGNKRGWLETMDAAAVAALPSANCGTTGGGVPVTSLGGNLSSDGTCVTWFTAGTDIVPNTDPKIGDLLDNGGPTLTHALAADSPALGRGLADGVTVDQRGVTRDATPDIGAFELVSSTTTTTSGGGGGGCAVGGSGRLDPTLPAMLVTALAFLGWRRRTVG